MKKLADISAFERLQNQAHTGLVSDLSLFNRRFSDKGVDVDESALDELSKLNDKDLPPKGMGANGIEKILVGVNKLVYRYYNDGDVLNSVDKYDETKDVDLLRDYDDWIDTLEKETGNHYYKSDFIPNRELPDALHDFRVSDAFSDVYDDEDLAWLDDYVNQIIGVNPEYAPYIQALRDANTASEYTQALNELVRFTVSDLNTRWHFKDIPSDEVKGWFR